MNNRTPRFAPDPDRISRQLHVHSNILDLGKISPEMLEALEAGANPSGLTNNQLARLNAVKLDGDGTKVLHDNGEYKEASSTGQVTALTNDEIDDIFNKL